MFIFDLLQLTQKAHVIQGYIGCYRHPSGPYSILKEESGELEVVLGLQGDLYSKVSNVGNGIDPTRSPDDLLQILDLPISDNIDILHAINSLCISDHKGSFSGNPICT